MSVVCRYILATHIATDLFSVNWYANSKQSWPNTATTNGIGATLQWPVLTLNETAPTNTAIRSLQSVMACVMSREGNVCAYVHLPHALLIGTICSRSIRTYIAG